MSKLELSLGRTCGLTFAGIKTGSLIRLSSADAASLGYYINCFKKKNIYFKIIKRNESYILLYIYCKKQLQARLFSQEVRNFLNGLGYEYSSVDQAICALRSRMEGENFPHEIGVFLDYDLEDVQRFITSPNEGVLLNGYWKVYGDVEKKAKLFEKFNKCSQNICNKLMSDKRLTEIFNVG